MELSVIIPTHNRPDKLRALLRCLRQQNMDPLAYEMVVVDDGSVPPPQLPEEPGGPACSLLRLEGVERSAARNAGAAAAKGALLLFLDDDLIISPDFIQ